MPAFTTYLDRLAENLTRVATTQADAICTAADWIATSLGEGGVTHLFGSGHSHMVAEEVFHRAGSLLPLNPILDLNLTILSTVNATLLERSSG